jgi:ribosome-associated toxin RatA of RatAB toxin-antitoxin module
VTIVDKSALVPYSAEEMYALVADIAAYGEFLPWCGGAHILSQEADRVVAAIDIAYKNIHKTFTTENRLVPGEKMVMNLLDGPFRYLRGHWSFASLDADASKISLHLEFEFSNLLMAMAMGPVFSGMANSMVDSFRRRAEQVYGKR